MCRAALGLFSFVACLVACDRRAAPPPAEPYAPAPADATSDPSPAAAPGAPPTASPGCGKAPPKGGALHVQVGGRDRTYILAIPDGYASSKPYPLVMVLHGGGASASSARAQTDLERVAAGRAIFAYPQAARGSWDLDGGSDVALFDAVLLALHNSVCVEPRRVFLTGFSNGAYMANQLGCRRGDRIRAIVTHAGGGPYELAGSYDAHGRLVCPGKAVASLVVHGNSDGTVAPSEGQKSVDHWGFANRCGQGTAPAWSPPCVALQGCVQPVGVCRVPGLGHGLWREAGRVTWAFFDALK